MNFPYFQEKEIASNSLGYNTLREFIQQNSKNCARLAGNSRKRIPGMEAHCSMHAVIENQLAMDAPPLTKITMARLLAAGVSRHDSVHAIANAMRQELLLMMKSNQEFKEARYCKALKGIDPKMWIRKDKNK